jgi:hypothetical protein
VLLRLAQGNDISFSPNQQLKMPMYDATLCNVGIGSCVTSIVGPNGMRNCTREMKEELRVRQSGVLISSHRKPLSSKAMVVNVAEKSGHDPGRQG